MSDRSIEALIFYTGFCDMMKQADGKLKGEEKLLFEKAFPFFSYEAVDYVLEKFPNLKIAGIDSFSFDPQGSKSECHRTFFEKDVLLLETVYNLDRLRDHAGNRPFYLTCEPFYLWGDEKQVNSYAKVNAGEEKK